MSAPQSTKKAVGPTSCARVGASDERLSCRHTKKPRSAFTARLEPSERQIVGAPLVRGPLDWSLTAASASVEVTDWDRHAIVQQWAAGRAALAKDADAALPSDAAEAG